MNEQWYLETADGNDNLVCCTLHVKQRFSISQNRPLTVCASVSSFGILKTGSSRVRTAAVDVGPVWRIDGAGRPEATEFHSKEPNQIEIIRTWPASISSTEERRRCQLVIPSEQTWVPSSRIFERTFNRDVSPPESRNRASTTPAD